MSLTYIIKFRVSRANYMRLIEESRSMGFGKLADFTRHKLFGPAMFIEALLKENNVMLKSLCNNFDIPLKKHKKLHRAVLKEDFGGVE